MLLIDKQVANIEEIEISVVTSSFSCSYQVDDNEAIRFSKSICLKVIHRCVDLLYPYNITEYLENVATTIQ